MTNMENTTAVRPLEIFSNQTTSSLSFRDGAMTEGREKLVSTIGNFLSTESSSMTPKPGFRGDGGMLLSAEVYTEAADVMDTLSDAVQFFGIVFNIINIAVLTRRRMRSPTTSYLIAISSLQLVYLLLVLAETIYSFFYPVSFTDQIYLLYSIYVGNYFLSCARRVMYLLQLCVSGERLLAVLVPLKARHFLLVRRPSLFILPTPILVLLLHIHVALKLEVFQQPTKGPANETLYSYRYTAAYERDSHFFDTASIVLKSLFVYLSLSLLLLVNIAVLVVLRRYTGRREFLKTNIDRAASEKRERQMTITILVSTLIFVILCLPTVSNSLVYNILPDSYGPFVPKHRYLFYFIQQFGGLCFLLAFSTDFFTYISLSSMYRSTLLCMLGRGKGGEAVVTATRRLPGSEVMSYSNDFDNASHI